MMLWTNSLAGLLIALAGFAGCLSEHSAGPQADSPPAAEEPSVPRTESYEFSVSARYSVSAAGFAFGDMEGVGYLDVPANATDLNVQATWSAGVGIGDAQHCMVHDGTGRKVGPVLVAANGTSPLHVGPLNLTTEFAVVAVMCWVDGEAGAAGPRETRLVASFRINVG